MFVQFSTLAAVVKYQVPSCSTVRCEDAHLPLWEIGKSRFFLKTWCEVSWKGCPHEDVIVFWHAGVAPSVTVFGDRAHTEAIRLNVVTRLPLI